MPFELDFATSNRVKKLPQWAQDLVRNLLIQIHHLEKNTDNLRYDNDRSADRIWQAMQALLATHSSPAEAAKRAITILEGNGDVEEES